MSKEGKPYLKGVIRPKAAPSPPQIDDYALTGHPQVVIIKELQEQTRLLRDVSEKLSIIELRSQRPFNG